MRVTLELEKGEYMRIFVPVVVLGLFLAGCVGEIKAPHKVPACSGSLVKGCSPTVYFNLNSAMISPYGQKRLDWAYRKMIRWPKLMVTITGYADENGSEEYNLELSRLRALSARLYLINRGIDPRRIIVDYKGLSEPLCTGNKNCYGIDRRVVLQIFNKKTLDVNI